MRNSVGQILHAGAVIILYAVMVLCLLTARTYLRMICMHTICSFFPIRHDRCTFNNPFPCLQVADHIRDNCYKGNIPCPLKSLGCVVEVKRVLIALLDIKDVSATLQSGRCILSYSRGCYVDK